MAKRQSQPRPPEIIGVAGVYAGQQFMLAEQDDVIIGRDENQCNLVILSGKISRKHCMVTYDKLVNMYKVTDYSTNGTWVDDRRRLFREETRFVARGTVLSLATSENRIRLQ